MIFRNKKDREIENNLKAKESGQSYGTIVKQEFQKNKLAKWSLRVLFVFLFIAVFADFIANEKPIYCQIEGKTYFPILKDYAVDLGLSKWNKKFYRTPWSEHDYEKVIMPPIPYSHNTLDFDNASFVSPFGDQNVSSNRYWHWMGTDQLGHDIAAGMVRGTRIAMLVGIISMSIASVIGIFFGVLAGFFGDNRFQISRVRLMLNLIGLFFAFFYAFKVRSYILSTAGKEGILGMELLKSLIIFFVIILLSNVFSTALEKKLSLTQRITIPIDIIVMRLIEIMNSIPALFLLLAAVTILEHPSIISVMIIIGLIRWTSIARFIRAELLRVRSLEYIEAAEAMGFSNWKIIFRHAIPNAIAPVLITIAFGIASAILIEAFLSFLGIGLAADEVTWGKLLSYARESSKSWWLAVFPGFAIFITIILFNLIGDGLTEALDPKLRK